MKNLECVPGSKAALPFLLRVSMWLAIRGAKERSRGQLRFRVRPDVPAVNPEPQDAAPSNA